jgi:hypothetical protein
MIRISVIGHRPSLHFAQSSNNVLDPMREVSPCHYPFRSRLGTVVRYRPDYPGFCYGTTHKTLEYHVDMDNRESSESSLLEKVFIGRTIEWR